MSTVNGLQYAPWERIQAVRDARARELAMHAAATVPHYRDLWRDAGIDPASIHSAEDLDRLPLVEKADLRAASESFRSDDPAFAPALLLRGSGSIGVPVEVCYDSEALLTSAVIGRRQRVIVRTVCGRGSMRVLRFDHPISALHDVAAANSRLFITPRRKQPSFSIEEPLERAVEAIEATAPDIVIGYGTYLEALFRTIGDPRELDHRPRAVRYHGDSMSEAGVRMIEDVFGIPVLGTYGAVECFRIGDICEARRGYHIHADVCGVSIVDRAGRPVAPGEQGEVVISNLFNRASVILNYRLGDIAAIDPEPCPCGRTTPRLVSLHGRVDEILRLGSGTLLHPHAVSAAIRELPGYRQYQLAQLDPDRFELRLVADSDEAFARAAALAVPALERLLEGASVAAVRRESLDTVGRGKLRRVIPLSGAGG
jgi:phenylacetate-CoA ligase